MQIGTNGAPKPPCRIRKNTNCSRFCAKPQQTEAKVKPIEQYSIRLRRLNREASQPEAGVTMAVATMLKVTTRAIWSTVAANVPCIFGNATLAIITVIV
jgi:hypothetical protein